MAAIGVGPRGAAVSRQAGNLGNMVAVCDVNRNTAARFAQEYDGKPSTCTDYRQVLDRKDVDVVIVGTPDLARSGRLGNKLHALVSLDPAPVHGARQGPFEPQEPPADLGWDFGQGPAPERPFTPNRIGWNFRWWWEYSGGQVTDWGIHHTDIALWALGAEESGPLEVEGQGELASGVPEDLDVNAYLAEPQALAGMYTVFMRFACTLRLAGGHTIHLADREWLNEQVINLYRGMKMTNHMGNFFDCVGDRNLPISDVFTHNRAMEAAHIANIAMLLRRKLQWDPQRRQFKDDDEANAHPIVSRPQREPWTIQV